MDTATHQLFIQQLCHWATSYIARGRSPFRKAEAGPVLSTGLGTLSPDMVLWINQDSFVAGGLVQVPHNDDDSLELPCACAESLGVNFFALWGTKSLTIWQADTRKIVEQWPIPKLTNDSARAYEMLLVQLMDEFRTLAVLGACPPEKLSHWHLTNLCQGTLAKAKPFLSEFLRRTRSDQVKSIAQAEQQAEDKLTLTIARLLILQYLKKLPYNIEPENLDNALKQFSADLDNPHLDQIEGTSDEPELDDQSLILLHHLFRRSDQIGLFRNEQRATRFLAQMLNGAPDCLPAANDIDSADALHVYCDTTTSNDGTLTEVDQPQRLALKYLLRLLNGWPHPSHSLGDLFSLSPDTSPKRIVATLSDLSVPATHYRNAWQAHIHAAWSGRRPSLPRQTPTWCYQIVYLLGLLKEQGRAQFCLPATAFCLPWGELLLTMLHNEYTILELQQGEKFFHLSLARENRPEQIIQIAGAMRHTEKTNAELFKSGAIHLALNLNAEDGLLELVDEKRLVPLAGHIPESEGIKRFHKSCLARQLQLALQGDQDNAKHFDYVPVPSPAILSNLEALDLDGLNTTRQRELIDTTLQQVLGIDSSPCAADKKTLTVEDASRVDKKSLEEHIYHILETKGVPLFPDHYLYDHFRPELKSFFTEHPPWTLQGEFMGTITLLDTAGNHRECDSDILAYSAMLISRAEATMDLPIDKEICRQILERHLIDLLGIRQLILDECHAALPTAYEANRLGSKIWKHLQLPPFKRVEEAVERFKIIQP